MDSFKEAHEWAIEAVDRHVGLSDEDRGLFKFYLRAMEAQGYKLVPVKPTQEMIEAGNEGNPTAWTEETDPGFAYDAAAEIIYEAIAAAPTVDELLTEPPRSEG